MLKIYQRSAQRLRSNSDEDWKCAKKIHKQHRNSKEITTVTYEIHKERNLG